jgi:hypothetical protein
MWLAVDGRAGRLGGAWGRGTGQCRGASKRSGSLSAAAALATRVAATALGLIRRRGRDRPRRRAAAQSGFGLFWDKIHRNPDLPLVINAPGACPRVAAQPAGSDAVCDAREYLCLFCSPDAVRPSEHTSYAHRPGKAWLVRLWDPPPWHSPGGTALAAPKTTKKPRLHVQAAGCERVRVGCFRLAPGQITCV